MKVIVKNLMGLFFVLLIFLSPAFAEQPSLSLDKTVFSPGEDISVHFTAPPGYPDNAWVGIIPSNVSHGSEAENDKYDITYQFLNGRTSGTLVFKAPTQPGNYDFRMNDNDNGGKEVASVSFTVGNAASLSLDKTVFSPGEDISVHFSAPPGYPDNAWVGIIPSSVAHGSEAENDKYDITYQFLNGRTSGTLVFKAPTQPGNYDFRMNDRDDGGREVASVSFMVR